MSEKGVQTARLSRFYRDKPYIVLNSMLCLILLVPLQVSNIVYSYYDFEIIHFPFPKSISLIPLVCLQSQFQTINHF